MLNMPILKLFNFNEEQLLVIFNLKMCQIWLWF